LSDFRKPEARNQRQEIRKKYSLILLPASDFLHPERTGTLSDFRKPEARNQRQEIRKKYSLILLPASDFLHPERTGTLSAFFESDKGTGSIRDEKVFCGVTPN
jgi:hypothetical protein